MSKTQSPRSSSGGVRVEELRDALAPTFIGPIVCPGDPDYDEARTLYNAMFDRRPSLIARCTGVADVVAAVKFARERDLAFSVRGSGHAVDGKALADDVMAIDLLPMDAVIVDPVRRIATVQAGARWRPVDRESQLHGLALTAGTVSDTGVAGLTLGGGLGYAVRMLGPTVDSLVAIDCVTVDGDVVRASEEENPDLFWAMRGGGGNFAIATTFHFKLHELGPVIYAGMLCYPGDRAGEILRAWRDVMQGAPDELMAIALLVRAPAAPLFPTELHGKLVIVMYVAYFGDPDDGEAAVAPFRSLEPIFDGVHKMPYVELQQAQEASTVSSGMRWYEKASYVSVLGDDFIDQCVAALDVAPIGIPAERSRSLVGIWRMGGQSTRPPEDSMAFVRQDAEYMVTISSSWRHAAEDDRWIDWVRQTYGSLEPGMSQHIYFNLATWDDPDAPLARAYGNDKYERLAAIKAKWDPDNVLRYGKNIAPGAAQAQT